MRAFSQNKLIEFSQLYWNDASGTDGICSLEGVINSSGFSTRGAGRQGDDHRGWDARFWTVTEYNVNPEYAFYVGLDCGDIPIYRSTNDKGGGISVRCVKDN